MKVGFLGSGAWGMALIELLLQNGHDVLMWTIEPEVVRSLMEEKRHPRFPDRAIDPRLKATASMPELLQSGCDVIIECVTAKGVRPVCEQIKRGGGLTVPFILTSKGMEQDTLLFLPQVAQEVLGEQIDAQLGYLSGPTLAKEVTEQHMTGVVGASTNPQVQKLIAQLFHSEAFHVFPGTDVLGVGLGGALKNVIAIATGLCTGLGMGMNTKALLLTMGLQEMIAISDKMGLSKKTCVSLAGIGDLLVTGMSPLSRNFRFGELIGKGMDISQAEAEIKMVVEGKNAVVPLWKLGQRWDINLPVTQMVYDITILGQSPRECFSHLTEKALTGAFS